MSAASDFTYGNVLELFWRDRPDQVLPLLIEQGKVLATLGTGGPDAEASPAAWLLAWPREEYGLIAFVAAGRDGANSQFVTAWPFSTTGVTHDLGIQRVHRDKDNGLIRMYECSSDGGQLVVFDTFCHGTGLGISEGTTARACLHAWAVSLRHASPDPIVLKADQVSPDILHAFKEVFARDGQVELNVDHLAMIAPAGKVATPLHQIRGSVKSIRLAPAILGLTIWVLIVTVSRTSDGEPEFDIEVSVTSETWSGDHPRIGGTVQGTVWLQAVIS